MNVQRVKVGRRIISASCFKHAARKHLVDVNLKPGEARTDVSPDEALMGGAVSLVRHLCVSWGIIVRTHRSKSSIPAHSHTCGTWLLAGATLRGEEECWVSITGHSSSHTPNILCVACVCTCFMCLFDRDHLSTCGESAVDSCFGIFSIFRLELWLIKDFQIHYEVKDPEDSCYISI